MVMRVVLLALLALVVLAPAPALGADCGQMEARLKAATDSGGYGSVARELPLLLSPQWLKETGMKGEDAVRCATAITGETVLVINSALSAGIPRDIIKKGLDDPFEYESVLKEVPEKPATYFETVNRTRLEFLLAGGLGLDNPTVGVTTSGEDVSLSGGGGAGALLTIGRGIRENWDIDITLGYQMSLLTPEPEGADGGFTRSMALLTMKYRSRVADRAWVKYGFGAGYYMPGKYELDDPSQPLEVEYKAAPGVHLSVEYETVLGKESTTMSFVFGLKYYWVVYEAESAKILGMDVLPSRLPRELRDLDGSGVDVIIGLAAYY